MKITKKQIFTEAGFLLLFCFFLAGVFFLMALCWHPTGEARYAEDDYMVTLMLDAEDDTFTILNLTDIQLCDLEDIGKFDTIRAEIDELVERADPDLITVTGDLVWSNENNISLHALIRWLEGYGIPWAPVVGNHDLGNTYGGATASGDYFVSLLENAENCLFRHGPRELGIGNYIVSVMQGDRLCKVLYFMDAGYGDTVTEAQKTWFVENASALEAQYGQEITGALFLHKPLSEYADAYRDYVYGENGVTAIGGVYVSCSLEGVDSNGLFPLLQEHNIRDVVCGHQHTNAFTLNYGGIRLTFGLKTGELSFYWDDGEINLNGGTLFTFTDEEVSVELLTVDREKYHFAGSTNLWSELYGN